MTPSIAGSRPLRAASLILILFLAAASWAQKPVVNLPKPDSAGWIKLFRGTNTGDFYTFTASGLVAPADNKEAFPGGPFSILGGDTIGTTGSPNAQLIFRQPFSHYRMQVQMRWPGPQGNTGIMTKIQENDSSQGGALPRAIECQGDPNQGMGQIWALGSIGGVSGGTWITVRAKMITHPQRRGTYKAAQADSTAPEIDYGGVGAPTDNLIVGFPGWQLPRPAAQWVTFEVESHGRDTTRHYIDGRKVMEYRNPRIAPRNNANQVIKYLTEGLLSLQSEGTVIWYRNFRIKLLPEDPLYASLYPSTAARDFRILPKAPIKAGWSLQGGVLTLRSEDRAPATLTGRLFPRLRLEP